MGPKTGVYNTLGDDMAIPIFLVSIYIVLFQIPSPMYKVQEMGLKTGVYNTVGNTSKQLSSVKYMKIISDNYMQLTV